jgi:hypothetical protein
MTIRELYEQAIKSLPPADRFELATMILGEIPRQSIVDYSDEWSEQDLEDFTRASWHRIESDPQYGYDD